MVHGKALPSLHCDILLSAQLLVTKLSVLCLNFVSFVERKKDCLLNSTSQSGSDSPVNKIKTVFAVKCLSFDMKFQQH